MSTIPYGPNDEYKIGTMDWEFRQRGQVFAWLMSKNAGFRPAPE